MKIGFEVNSSAQSVLPTVQSYGIPEELRPSKVATPKVHGFKEKLLFKKT